MFNPHAGTISGSDPGAPDTMGLTDQLLLSRFVDKRDQAAFAGLVERHGRTVWGVCRRFLRQPQDAEDAFQAVFLVFARKAASIRKGQSVGSWLYGVAYRTALKARRSAARRQKYEQQAAPVRPEESPTTEAAARELQRALDEEVQRLADKYRAPFVLCCLEGMSRAEAARELGWKEGTLSNRLALARQQLQRRLGRRGITLSAVLTAVALTQGSAAAAVPAPLAGATVIGVSATLAGNGTLSPAVLSLADNVGRSLMLNRLKAAAGLVAAILLFLLLASLTAFHSGTVSEEPLMEPETFLPPPVVLGTPTDEQVVAVAFSPDGQRLVTAGGKRALPGQLKIWDVASRKELATVGRIAGVRAVVFSPDGQTLLTGDSGGAIRLRDPRSGAERDMVEAHARGVHGLALSPQGDVLASAGMDRTVKLWSLPGLQEQKVFSGHTDVVQAVAFFRTRRAIVTGSRDRTAKIWDLETGKERLALSGHQAEILAVAVSPDDAVAATASRDRTVRLWDAASGKETAVLHSKPQGESSSPGGSAFFAVAFSPDGMLVAGAAGDGTISVWDASTRQLLGTLGKHKAAVWALAFTLDGKYLASGSADKSVKLWKNLPAGSEEAELWTSWSAHKPVVAAAYAPDGKTLAVATKDKTLHIRDAASGDVLRVMAGHAGDVTCLAYSADGTLLASGSADKTIKLWDPAMGQEVRTLTGHDGGVHAVAFTADGQRLISGGADGIIRLWDPVTGKELATLKGHNVAVHALAVSADGRTLASGGQEGTIKLWDLITHAETRSFQAHQGTIRALAFARDGTLASAGDDSLVKLWEPGQVRERHTLKGHIGPVQALAFSPGGKVLVSGGQDKTVRVWEPHSGQARGLLERHKDAVTALTIHPRGKDLVSGSLDTTLLRWQGGKAVAPPAIVRRPQPIQYKQAPLAVAPSSPPAQKNYAQEFYHSLKGTEEIPGLELIGHDAQQFVSFEPAGVRVSLPTGLMGYYRGIGLASGFGAKGDFEATVAFEVLSEAAPADAGTGTIVLLRVDLDAPAEDTMSFGRGVFPKFPCRFSSFRAKRDERTGKFKEDWQSFPAQIRKGQLRLVRTGSVLSYYACGETGNEFELITQHPFGADDVKHVVFGGSSGGSKAALDVRFTDLRIRADSLPNAPVSTPQDAGPRFPVLAFTLAMTGVLFLTAWFWIWRRRRRAQTAIAARTSPAASSLPLGVSFRMWLLAVISVAAVIGLLILIASGSQSSRAPAPAAFTTTSGAVVQFVSLEPKDGLVCLVVNGNSGRCLSVRGGSVEPGAKIVQARLPEEAGPSERWVLRAAGQAFRLENEQSKLVLEIGSANLSKGVQAIQWHDQPNRPNQHWIFEQVQDGYLLKARHSQLVLGVGQGKVEDGVRVIQWPRVANVPDQVWQLRSPDAESPRQAELRAEYSQSFRGKPENMQGLELLGPDGDKCVKFEPAGLRIALPAGSGQEFAAGLGTGVTVRGDFEITVDFELLQEPEPTDAGPFGTRLSLVAGGAENPGENTAKISRGIGMPQGRQFIAFWNVSGKAVRRTKRAVTDASSGRLRLSRTGQVLSYFVAGPGDKDFTLLHRVPFMADDLENVRIVGTVGGPAAALDFRITDLRIRAQALPAITPAPSNGLATPRWLAIATLAISLLVAVVAVTRSQKAKKWWLLGSGALAAVAALLFVMGPQPSSEPTAAPGFDSRDGSASSTTRVTFELYQDFRGQPVAPELSLFGDKEGKLMQLGPDGLRITLPKDRDPLFAVGVTTTPGLRGDFEITATLEILQAEKPAAGYGVGVGMMVKKAAPSKEAATLCRLLRPWAGQVVLADRSIEVPKPKIEEVTWPCTDTLGRLRYKRTGSVLSYQWAPGTTGDHFHEVHSCRFGTDDIERVSLSALTGRQPCALDVRLLDWRLRSTSQTAEARPIAPAAGAPGGKFGLMAALVLVLLVGIALALRRGRPAATVESSGAAFHSLTCNGCGTTMKAKAELAGKKVKCPRCGLAVRVPDIKTAPSTPSS